MIIDTVRLVYFSPTHTTQKILSYIAGGIDAGEVRHDDVTLPAPEPRDIPDLGADDLLIIGAPVYAGRIAPPAMRRFEGLKGNDTPAVIVAVYGNRDYEDALVELADLVTAAGFRPVAAGAFIGEHSFSSEAMPIAAGRPDGADAATAAAFGQRVRDIVDGIASMKEIPTLALPGNRPYHEPPGFHRPPPMTDDDACIRCGSCVSVCPMAAITLNDSISTDGALCINCAACLRACPTGARRMDSPDMARIQERLSNIAAGRKEPDTFFTGR